jgi:CheY-like chemotaxis protein
MTFVDPDIPTILNGDFGRLHQLLLNLVGNAVKFTDKGEIIVHAMLYDATPTQVTLHLSVSDTGIGLAPETLERLFEPFRQADNSTTRRFGGTGLGLAICKRLVELMGGEIGVESTIGQGATFWLRIPFAVSLAAPQKQYSNAHLSSLHDTKVLIVDDSASARLILGRYLSKLKARSGAASSGKNALTDLREALAANDPYDVAVIDLVMPEMDGITLAHEIKQDPALADTALILITAYNTTANHQEAIEAGYLACLSKPIRQTQLVRAINARQNPDLAITDEAKSSPAKNPLASKQRILLVEDNHVNQMVASMQLERLGYNVQIVENGLQALDTLSQEPYDLVLMDCHMPEMDGFETTHRIRQKEIGSATHVRIIAMTANAMQGDREACLQAGMDDYIAKPIGLDDLSRMLDRWLNPDGIVGPEVSPAPVSAEPTPLVTLDLEALDNLCKLSKRSKPVVLRKLVDNFLSNTPKLLSDLRSAVEKADILAVQRAAHTLKSSSASYGASRLADMCKILETEARGGDLLGGIEQIEQIEAEYADVKRALEAQVRGI